MALKDIENKKIGFYTTITNNPVDSTMLPVIYKKSGNMIISYSEINNEESPHIWLGGEHVASGYGQNKYKDKLNLSYISNSYNLVWNFVEELDKYSPFLTNKEYRAAVLKDSNSYSFSSYTLIIGENSFIASDSKNSTILGPNSKLQGNSSVSIGTNNIVRSGNSFVAGSYIETPKSFNQFIMGLYPKVSVDTLFALGNGIDRQHYSNVIEVSKDGDLYIKGIGVAEDKSSDTYFLNKLYTGDNIDEKPQSFQSYISSAFSYTREFAKYYTDNRIKELIGGAPEYLHTLKEIADYISDIEDNSYIPVPDYNKLNSSTNYYYCAWDREIKNVSELTDDSIELTLREAWNNKYRTFNEVKEYFNRYFPYNNSIRLELIYESRGIYVDDDELISNNTSEDNYYIPDKENTKLRYEEQREMNQVKSLYNWLHRYVSTNEDIESIYYTHINNGLVYYYKEESNTSLISSVHQIQSSYIINNGTGKSNVSYTWVPSIGENVYLDTIFDSILERPKYTKPELKISYTENIFEVGSLVSPEIYFTLGDTVSNPNIINEDRISNEGRGYSYSYMDNNKLKGFKINIFSGDYTVNVVNNIYLMNDINANYNFKELRIEERDYELITYMKYYYNHPTYMFYPQLLDNNQKVICYHGWYNDDYSINNDKFIISGRYKYYWGWDRLPDKTDLLTTYNGWGWLNHQENSITEVKIPFENESHYELWFACPYNLFELIDTENKTILYKTSVASQNLISETVDYSEEITLNYIGSCNRNYKIYKIDFNRRDTYYNRPLQGYPGNYIKFTFKKLK